MKLLLDAGRLTRIGVFSCVIFGFLLVYLSVEFIPWKWGKLIGLCVGITIAATGGFSGRANALEVPPPFTNDPLGWRKAKESYKSDPAQTDDPSKDKNP